MDIQSCLMLLITMFFLLNAAEFTNAACEDKFDYRGIMLSDCAFVNNNDIVSIQSGLQNCVVPFDEESQCPFIVRDSA